MVRNRILSICAASLMASSCLVATAQSNPRQLAISLEQQGKNAEAEAAWQSLVAAQPTNPEPFAHLGLLEARQEHYAAAIGFYCKALAIDPSMPGLELNLGLSLFKNGDYRPAIAIFEPLHKAEPDDQRLNILLGMSYYGLAEYTAADPYLRHAAAQDSSNLTLQLTVAHSCLLSHQYPCVLDAFHQIVALDAESAEADMLVGEALDEMKDPDGAIREFRAAVKANPREPNVHFGLGYLLWTKSRYDDAAAEFKAELDYDPRHQQARLYLADSLMQGNHADQARLMLEQLVAADPQSAMAHLDYGIVLSDAGDKQQALTELQAAIRIAPGNVNAHWRLGRLYRSLGKTAEAMAELDKANSLNRAEDDRLLKVMSTIPKTAAPSSPTPR